MNKLPLILVATLAACSQPAQEPAQEPQVNQAETAAPAAEEAAPVPSLAGTWGVASIDTRPLTQAYDMSAQFADGQMTIASDCVRIGWNYTQDRNIVTFTPAPVVSCERGRTTNEKEIEGVIGQANIAMFSDGGNEVQISGPGGLVTMNRR